MAVNSTQIGQRLPQSIVDQLDALNRVLYVSMSGSLEPYFNDAGVHADDSYIVTSNFLSIIQSRALPHDADINLQVSLEDPDPYYSYHYPYNAPIFGGYSYLHGFSSDNVISDSYYIQASNSTAYGYSPFSSIQMGTNGVISPNNKTWISEYSSFSVLTLFNKLLTTQNLGGTFYSIIGDNKRLYSTQVQIKKHVAMVELAYREKLITRDEVYKYSPFLDAILLLEVNGELVDRPFGTYS